MSKVRTLLVAGAEGFLGLGVAQAFAARGLKIVATSRDAIGEARIKAAVPGAFTGVCDLGDEAQVQALLERAEKAAGPIDALVNCAGGFRWATVAETSVADLDFLLGSNARSSFILAKHLAPRLFGRGFGRMIFVSSRSTLEPAPLGLAAYVASKAAVNALVESLAAEAKAKTPGVTVNAVLPTMIDTPPNREAMPNEDASRWVAIPQLVEAIAFLIGDGGAAVNGALLPVAGRL